MIGKTLSYYKILAKLGEDGMSSLMRNRKKVTPHVGGVVYDWKNNLTLSHIRNVG